MKFGSPKEHGIQTIGIMYLPIADILIEFQCMQEPVYQRELKERETGN